MQVNSASLKFRGNAQDSGEFEGHASTFHNVDFGGDIVLRGAFRGSLAKHRAEGSTPALLWSHDGNEPIGRWQELKEDDTGLAVRGKLTLGVPRAKSAHALLKDDALSLSIGYHPVDYSYRDDGVRELKQVELIEASLVAIPMNPRARIGAVKAYSDKRTLETKLRDSNGSGFLWQQNLAQGVDAPDGLLLGKRVITTEELGVVGASPANNSILCGDFTVGYELTEIGPMSIVRDEVTDRGRVLFYIAQRFGGRIVDNDAVKVLQG